MKLFSPICILALLFLGSCQRDDIVINTGPVFPGAIMMEGTDVNTGAPVSAELVPNAGSVPIDAIFTLNFSKAVAAESASAVTLTQDGTPVEVAASVDGQSIVVDPTADLAYGTTYTLSVGSGIKAQDGGVIMESLSRTFTTATIAPPALYDGLVFYMPFDGSYTERISQTDATVVGTPGFAGEGVQGDSYAGAADSYLTFPGENLKTTELSASFWMKVNATPDRGGILVMGPPDPDKPATPNNRTAGFRFFRENASGMQRFKLNVGNGTADDWFDGGAAADVDPALDQWVHFAFAISETEAAVYVNGEVVSQGPFGGISWEGVDILSIMSGAPRFTEWGHLSDESYIDELRIFNRALSAENVAAIYQTESLSQTLAMPFDGNYVDVVSGTEATVVGTPGFAGEAIQGSDAYAGAADSYLTFPTDGLLGEEFTASFWLKINAVPDRAGILVIGPPDPDKPDTPNNRKAGFRFFRENADGKQRFKLNVGDGTADVYFDGGTAADVDPALDQWVHFAFTISSTEGVVYIDGEVVKQGAFTGVSWEGCDVLSIMSGAPRFTEWGHLSDQSDMDDLRLFSKALTQAQIQSIMNE